MLVIRPEQLEILKSVRRSQFRRDVLARAEAEIPGVCATVSSEALLSCIDAAIERAEDRDIFGEAFVARFALLSVILTFAPPEASVVRAALAAFDDDLLSVPQQLDRAEALLQDGTGSWR